jgi:flagellar protein FlaJ
MFTYLVVVYVSFLVFLVVIGALEHVLIPNLPEAGAFSGGQAGAAPGVFGGFGDTDRESYRLVFFHTAVIQSSLSGLVAGVMGSGSIKDGMKHATIMLAITYVVLTLLV